MRLCVCAWCISLPTLFHQTSPILSLCSSLKVRLPLIRNISWNETYIRIRALAELLSRLTQLRQLTSALITRKYDIFIARGHLSHPAHRDEELLIMSENWVTSKQSMLAWRICAKSAPWLSRSFLDPVMNARNAYPLPYAMENYLKHWGNLTLAHPSNKVTKFGYEIDIDRAVKDRKKHLRALRYKDMRGLSTVYVKDTGLQESQTYPRRYHLELTEAIPLRTKKRSKIPSLATDFSEADLLRMCLVGMFLMGSLRHFVNQSGIEHVRQPHGAH